MLNGNGSVLLLDDDEDLRPALADLIARLAHCHVVPLGSVAELDKSNSCALKTNIAFLDVNLGPNEPNGLDAYRWLKSHGYEGKILFITGHAKSHPTVQAALNTGNAKLLTKPVPIETLMEHVRGALGSSS
jgi:FixJ family two-component response regulator